ncbi:MAG: hypothetical protein AMJ69_04015 [Gammaproteobacteria bacterium SG8_47]|nr:MAG: hypothetical protein AMJ69_04015 [Gammaproteobacteria bacterium SG8_47]
MNSTVVVIGLGEMGGVFSRGFLRCGHPVYPVTRHVDIREMARNVPEPALALVAVAENDLHSTLDALPSAWRDKVGLLQNELLPRDWQAHGLVDPTVVSVWFEKKKGQDYKVLVPSPTYGPGAALIEQALRSLDIPCWQVASEAELEFELVRKNVYILTTNIAGLVVGGNVNEMWSKHQHLARTVANDVMDIQFWLIGHELDREKLIAGMVEAINGDLEHKCMGRSAPARLERALQLADEAGLAVDRLREIQAQAAQS